MKTKQQIAEKIIIISNNQKLLLNISSIYIYLGVNVMKTERERESGRNT